MDKAYYAIIPANVRYDSNLKDKAKLLYGEITALCNEKGFCWATNDYFAQLYSISKFTISRLISNLKDRNYIKIEIIYNGKEILERRIYIAQYKGIDENSKRGIDENSKRGIDENSKDNNTSFNNTNIYSCVIDYLNKKAGTNYKATTKKTKQLINARLNEGFKEEDFLKVIDNKVADWKGTFNKDGVPMDNYLRPETLFGTKFESYLNQNCKKVSPVSNNKQSVKDNNYGAFPLD